MKNFLISFVLLSFLLCNCKQNDITSIKFENHSAIGITQIQIRTFDSDSWVTIFTGSINPGESRIITDIQGISIDILLQTSTAEKWITYSFHIPEGKETSYLFPAYVIAYTEGY
jgi:hypothetical protein